MSLAQLDITLVITNNKPYPQEASVMGNPSNLLDTSNATREFRWDITGFSITNENTISIQYKGNDSTTFNIFVADLGGNNNQSITEALNLLGIGFFYIYDELGFTYLSTYNQTTEFGNVDIYYVLPPSPPSSVTELAIQSGQILLTQSGIPLAIQQ